MYLPHFALSLPHVWLGCRPAYICNPIWLKNVRMGLTLYQCIVPHPAHGKLRWNKIQLSPQIKGEGFSFHILSLSLAGSMAPAPWWKGTAGESSSWLGGQEEEREEKSLEGRCTVCVSHDPCPPLTGLYFLIQVSLSNLNPITDKIHETFKAILDLNYWVNLELIVVCSL